MKEITSNVEDLKMGEYATIDYELLRDFLCNEKSGVKCEKKITKRGTSNTSYSFLRTKEEKTGNPFNDTLNCIKRTFGLKDFPDFDSYFEQATSGSGNEAIKIDTIWSSSLLSLLFFYSAIKCGGIKIKGITFTKCYFEFKNPVLKLNPNYTHPSNIDCVLMDDMNKNILFIESKFIEYVRDFRKKKVYDNDVLKESYKRRGEPTEKLYNWFSKLLNSATFEPHYYYGMKQMITHFSGICNFIDESIDSHPQMMRVSKSDYNPRKAIIEAKKNKPNLYLMEVVYDLSKGFDGKYKNHLDNYKHVQKLLLSKMNKNKPQQLKLLQLNTYQNLFKCVKNSDEFPITIKKFYSLDK